MAQFFIDQCRKNNHTFKSKTEEQNHLIFNHHPEYTGRYANEDFWAQQTYLFSAGVVHLSGMTHLILASILVPVLCIFDW